MLEPFPRYPQIQPNGHIKNHQCDLGRQLEEWSTGQNGAVGSSKNFIGDWMTQCLRILSPLAGNLSSRPSSYVRWLPLTSAQDI